MRVLPGVRLSSSACVTTTNRSAEQELMSKSVKKAQLSHSMQTTFAKLYNMRAIAQVCDGGGEMPVRGVACQGQLQKDAYCWSIELMF